jgi:hypothetical protein
MNEWMNEYRAGRRGSGKGECATNPLIIRITMIIIIWIMQQTEEGRAAGKGECARLAVEVLVGGHADSLEVLR